MRPRLIALLTTFVLGLAACSSMPADQITTLDGAVQAATLATKAVDLYVNTGKPDVAQLQQLQSLRAAERAALDDLQKASAAGQPLSFAAFNAARDAFVSYAAANGVKNP